MKDMCDRASSLSHAPLTLSTTLWLLYNYADFKLFLYDSALMENSESF